MFLISPNTKIRCLKYTVVHKICAATVNFVITLTNVDWF